MPNLSASDLAGRRIREVRQRYGWTVRELAERCARMGAARITSAVVTDLETRRRATREITVDELLILSEVLEVPPLELMAPLGVGELLEVVPQHSMDALTAVGWIAGDPPTLTPLIDAQFPGPGITEQLLRRGSNPVITVRQMRIVADSIWRWDDAAQYPEHDLEIPESNPRRAEIYARDIEVMADRLMHLAARMEAWGYEPPELGSVQRILQNRGLPSTLREWRERAAKSPVRYRDADRGREIDGEG
jgi:transcriptional regulator with XRE-family HTH domain